MTKRFRFTAFLAALGLFALGSGTASAAVINFSFENEGYVSDATPCGPNCLRVTTVGTAQETGGLAGTNTWSFLGVMEFTTGLIAIGDGAGEGLGWSFTDTTGANSLWGSFSSVAAVGVGVMNYVITGGTGLFAGATGSGSSTFLTLLGQFKEWGSMTVNTASVPEPAALGLLAASLGMMGLVARRRRRADTV